METKKVQRDTWVYVQMWVKKFGRLPKDTDELCACIDFVVKKMNS